MYNMVNGKLSNLIIPNISLQPLVLFSQIKRDISAHTISESASQCYSFTQEGGGGYTSISWKGMLVQEQISTTQKNRMTLNLNPKK